MNHNPMYQSNNRGTSILMVIIAITFVGVFGTIIISIATINLQMKTADRNSKYNFYSAETALDEIKTGLEEDTANNLSAAYDSILTKYSKMNSAMRKQSFRERFVEGMKSALGISPTGNSISLSVLNAYLKETKKIALSGDGAEVIGAPTFDSSGSELYVVISGLEVIYQSKGYTTSITTDVRIDIPSVEGGAMIQTPFMEYALIGDKGLKANFTDNTILGSIYGGSQGMNTGFGNRVTITGNRIIVKGDIAVKDSGELIISGTGAEVWADNLITTQTNKGEEISTASTINIMGDCYIKDDLVLGAYNSKITLTGQYYGYSSGSGSEDNSSVVINAPKAKLDLSGLSKLYLAGRAFVSLEDGAGAVNYHADEAYGAGSNANCNILTGESLAVKGSQNVYLLPSRFIQVGHNPVSWNEYIHYFNTTTNKDGMAAIPVDAIAFDTASLSEEKKKFSYYLDELCPIKKAFYKFGVNDNVVYYYLNFKSQELATEYFQNYMKYYPDRVYNGFPVESIKLNTAPGACISAGNLMTYDTGISLLRGTNGIFTNHYGDTFMNLTATLHKNIAGTNEPVEDNVFENIIDTAKLKADAATYTDGKLIDREITIDSVNYYVCVIDNENRESFDFNLSGKKGIIVATGDISVNRNFTGLILANGVIELNASQLNADSEMVAKILSSDPELSKYFNAFKTSQTDSVKVSDLIAFENWKKN